MRVLKLSFQNSSNVGLFGFATDSYCLLPKNLKDSLVNEIKEALAVPVHQVNIYNTHLIGMFCVMTLHHHLILIGVMLIGH